MAWSHVACCLDRDERTDEVLALAREVARESGARLTLVHGAPRAMLEHREGGHWAVAEADPSRAATEWLERLGARVGAETALLTGTTAAAVREWAERAGPDLLVVGASRGPLARVTVGGFASYLAYHSPCHVLVARPRARGAERIDPPSQEER